MTPPPGGTDDLERELDRAFDLAVGAMDRAYEEGRLEPEAIAKAIGDFRRNHPYKGGDMTAAEPAEGLKGGPTILVVAHPSGDWSVASRDQSPESVAALRALASATGCRLVRYPFDAWLRRARIDFGLAEEVA